MHFPVFVIDRATVSQPVAKYCFFDRFTGKGIGLDDPRLKRFKRRLSDMGSEGKTEPLVLPTSSS